MFAAAVLLLSLASPVTFTDFRTANGMRVLLAPDASASEVAVSLTYDFGSRNERPGQTGVANLLHTALLRDLQRQCKEKLLIADEACRGSNNQERTSYTLTIPADRLEAALSLLAGQMRAAGVDVDSVRAEILEKRRNEDAYARAAETLLDLSFTRFPYKHGVEGSEADLKALTAADVQQVFRTYFAPDNAALALAGGFDPAVAKRAIEKVFGSIPGRGPFPKVDTSEPAGSGERRTVIEDARAPHPQYLAAYRTVPSNHPDWYALNLLADILGQGPKSRLHRALVETKLVADLAEGMSESRGPSLFRVRLNLPPGGSLQKAEEVLDAEIARIQRDGVTEAELALAKTQEQDYWKQVLATPRGRAETLSRFATYYHSPELINGELKAILGMTAADVQRVARTYMNPGNRAVVLTIHRR